MMHEEKKILWEKYPDVWEMYEEFNGITQEDEEAWERLIDRAHAISHKHNLPEVNLILQETVYELDRISRKRGSYGGKERQHYQYRY